jgi:hypothetical protein
MTFGDALEHLKSGLRAQRAIWLPDEWLSVRFSAGTGDPIKPYVQRIDSSGRATPWTPGHADLLAEDWELMTSRHH